MATSGSYSNQHLQVSNESVFKLSQMLVSEFTFQRMVPLLITRDLYIQSCLNNASSLLGFPTLYNLF